MVAHTHSFPTSFADYIEAHKEYILTHLLHRIAQDNRIPSTEAVDFEALQDHLPEVLLDLCNFLREREDLEPADTMKKMQRLMACNAGSTVIHLKMLC